MTLHKTVVYLWMSSSSLDLAHHHDTQRPKSTARVRFMTDTPPPRCIQERSRKMSLQEPPVHVKTTFGFMGAVGVVVNIVLFIVDIVSDALLAYVLWKQADKMENKDVQSELFTWFIITLCIIILPMVVINIFSLLWYWQNKICLGDYCVLHKMSTSQAIIRVFIHLLLLGPLIRYLDILRYGIKMKREVKHVEMGTNGAHVQRRTPRGEVHAVLHMIIGRDTAMLDMMHSFLQDAPQLIFQIFLLYRSPKIIIGTEKISPTTTAVQVWKVLLGVFAMSWSLVSYQDELRRTVPNKTPLSCCATTTCLFWRAAMITSRIIAIGSFTAILPTGQNPQTALSLSWTDSGGNLVIPYPVVAMCILIGHWLIMTAWLHAQGTTFCSQENGSGRPVLELLYNCVMGLVHIFCYINVKDTPSRRRMVFFYTFCLIENSAIIAVWYVEMVMFPEWFRVGLIFSVEMLWLVGLCCVIGYYGFLHPDHTDLIQHREQASWRR